MENSNQKHSTTQNAPPKKRRKNHKNGIFKKIGHFFTYEPDDTPIDEAVSMAANDLEGVLYHINALRMHLLRSLIFVVITTIVSLAVTNDILLWLTKPLEGGLASLQAVEVTETVGVYMRIALFSGFVFALPYIGIEMITYFGEGMRRKTRLIVTFIILPAIFVLFVGGSAFAFFIMLPAGLPFLLNFIPIETVPRISSYVNFVLRVMFWIGISFEFPLIILIFARLGWVNASQLLKQWRIAVVAISILAAMVTPTVDPVNMAIVMGPLILLYFLSVLLAAVAQPAVSRAN
jgi:sec-independent protein translocase protein TatC